MKRDVTVRQGKVIVKVRADDAIEKARRLNLISNPDGTPRRLSDNERDLLILATWQMINELRRQDLAV